MKNKSSILVVIVVFFFLFGKQIVNLLVDYMWFDAVGYKGLFMVPLKAKLFLFVVAFVVSFIVFLISSLIALRGNKSFFRKLYLALGVGTSLFIGFVATFGWNTYLKYVNGSLFGIVDPIFGHDVSYYAFVLPFLSYITNMILLVIAVNAAWIVVIYFWNEIKLLMSQSQLPEQMIDLKKRAISTRAKNHVFLMACLFFLVIAVKHYLSRYSILFSRAGVVFGAGYSDVNVALPIANILVFVSIGIGIMFALRTVIRTRRVKRHHLIITLAAVYIIVVVSGVVFPGIVQTLKVNPNEFSLEEEYIKHNIKYTNIAYGLDSVTESFFDVTDDPDPAILEGKEDELKKLRILDWRPLQQTYEQLQEIRLYYDFADVDIGKYTIDGEKTQVMLSARELNHDQLRDKAKTWINEHMVFTHGYGLVMSPVNKISKEGLPEFLIKDIPPVSSEFSIERPEIYYGEISNSFVLVNTEIDEFDYPKGDLNKYTIYHGTGGVVIDSFAKKVLLALYFGDINIILNSDITDSSRILFNKQIQQRIGKIAPFLALDSDPYVVLVDGRIKWIQDAYTLTNRFPYSDPNRNFNYIRNPVKVVVDAYDGSVDFYMVATEPVIETYSKIYPGLLSMEEAPDEVKEHFRYPEDLFKIQVNMFSTYHMKDPKVYYNREDLWDIPNEIFGQGSSQVMTPYYVLLPDEYVIITPYTPVNKDNMIAWISGRVNSDTKNELVLFKFPKDKLVFGPSQIEARIDQNSDISEQLTLWSQRGSSVIRGNLLVIPIDNTLLYIEPLYITADNGEIPELKRIILSYGNKIVMEKDFETALNVLFEGKAIVVDDDGDNTNKKNTIEDALLYYNNIQDAMTNQDWKGIGDNMDRLEEALNELAKK